MLGTRNLEQLKALLLIITQSNLPEMAVKTVLDIRKFKRAIANRIDDLMLYRSVELNQVFMAESINDFSASLGKYIESLPRNTQNQLAEVKEQRPSNI